MDLVKALLNIRPSRPEVPKSQSILAHSPTDKLVEGSNLKSPFSIGRIFGNLLGHNDADLYGYTPLMRSILLSTAPAVVPRRFMPHDSAGMYDRRQNAISFRQGPSMAGLPTYEGLHAVWETMPPKQRKQYIQTVQKEATPENRSEIFSTIAQLSGEGAANVKDLTQANPITQNEIFSILGRVPNEVTPSIRSYYQPYLTKSGPWGVE